MKFLYSMLAKVLGRNSKNTPKDVIVEQMKEPRPLPMGIEEFHEWSDRLIAGAQLSYDPCKKREFVRSQKFVLASMIMHLKPTESHVCDAHFIHSLRKQAASEIAMQMITDIKQERLKEEEDRLKKELEDLALDRKADKVLEELGYEVDTCGTKKNS